MAALRKERTRFDGGAGFLPDTPAHGVCLGGIEARRSKASPLPPGVKHLPAIVGLFSKLALDGEQTVVFGNAFGTAQ